VQVMKFVVFVYQNKHYLDDMPSAEFETRFGKWQATKPKVEKMLAAVAKLSQ
jgi:hypothetical protein